MKLIRRIECEDTPYKIQFSHDGSRLWINIKDEIIETYVYESNTIRVNPTLLVAFDMAFINSEQIIAATITGRRQHKLVIYNILKQRITSQIHTQDVRSICVDYHRNRIFVGILTGGYFQDIVGIYNIVGHPQKKFTVGSMPFNMALSHLGDKLAIAGVFFEVWDVSDNPKRISPQIPTDGDCTGTPCEADSVDITPDGKYAVAGFHGAKRLCVVIDTENGTIIGWLGPEGDEIRYYHTSDIAISPDGKYVAVASPNILTVPVYRVLDGSIAYQFTVHPCGAVAFSPKGDILALGDQNSVTLWQFEP